MKFLTLLFVLVFSFATFADVCLEGRSISKDNLGNVVPASGELCYEIVVNTKGSDLVKGNIVVFDTGETDSFSVTTLATAGSVPKCMLMEDCVNGNACKCQTYGYTEDLLYDSAISTSIGKAIYISEAVAGYVSNNPAASIADIKIGYIRQTSPAASGAVKSMIDLR